jgi:hypothetical protein
MDTEIAQNLHQFVLAQLEARRGDWVSIARESGVPYNTITKIAQGAIVDPRVSKLQRLANYFRAKAAA